MANSNNWGEIYKSTWWGDKAWSANTLFIDSAPPGFGLNLLKASEDMDNTLDWITRTGASVSAQNTNDPNGELTAERVDFAADVNSRIQQLVTLEASTTYTFSVHAKVPSGSQDFRLKALGVTGVGSFTALSSDWTRFDFDFTTTTAGTYTLAIMNATDGAARSIQFWGAMLNEGADVGGYVKTEASVGGSSPTPEYSGFGDEFVGVTAYYSLRQFTEAETLNAIRVRRSSDDTEQDIGFDANGDLDSTALLAFVNESGNAYASDFTSGNEDLLETGGTGADGQSIADVSDAYKFTQDGSTGIHRAANPTNTNIVGGNISISFDYYLPSGQTSNRILFRTNDAGDAQVDLTTTDAWTTYSTTFSGIAGDSFLFYSAIIGQGLSFAGNGSDHFYLKNIVVTQTDADGAVTTFYDQTGNGNDATNSTESEQPLVVSGGTLVEENSKAAIDFDGVDDLLRSTLTIGTSQTDWGWFGVFTTGSNISSNNCVYGGRTSSGSGAIAFIGANNLNVRTDGTSSISGGVTANTQFLATQLQNSTSHDAYINGSTIGTASSVAMTNTTNAITLGSLAYADALFFFGKQQEMIFFKSDQSSIRTGIETNINDHFDIYTP